MITRRLPCFPSKIAYRYDASYDALDAMYFRRTTLDSYAVRFFRDVKKHNPKCKIVMELPTYPYDKEMSTFIEWPRLIKDRWSRRKLKQYIDRIVTLSDDDEIFGIPTIKTVNGIDFDTVPLRNITVSEIDTIHAVMVANFAPWHGVDRILEGMKRYKPYQSRRQFILHVVGRGHGMEKLQEFIRKEKMQETIVFHGMLNLEELQEIYDGCVIAINTLGAHRIGLYEKISSIKTREYGAKGLPIVSSIPIDYFGQSNPFVKMVPADESPIEIDDIITFFDQLNAAYESPFLLAQTIRDYAKDKASEVQMMDPILEYFKSN
jgi:glycosyltransferase involved in cell wall biosynthesis